MHEELRALPVSARSTWLIERNQKARAKIAQKIEALREQLHTSAK